MVQNSFTVGYLIIVILGSFTLSTDKPFHFADFDKNGLGSSNYYSSTTFTVDWMVENSPTISKAHRHSNHPLRNGLLRVLTLVGITGITGFTSKSNNKIKKNNIFPLFKNSILLKLRI